MAVATSDLCAKLDVHISAKGLRGADLLSKSDPMAVVSIAQGGQFVEIGRTEMIMNNHDPEFATPIAVDYFFEEKQTLTVALYDVDDPKTTKLGAQDFLGMATVDLAAIVGAAGNCKTLQLKSTTGANVKGVVRLTAEETSKVNTIARVDVYCKKLDDMDWFGKSDPFFVIQRMNENSTWTTVFRSPVIKNNLNPDWKVLEMKLAKICNGDLHRPLKISVYDADDDGSHDFIGEFEATFDTLIQAQETKQEFDVINTEKKKKKGKKYKNSGTFGVKSIIMEERPSFVDYLSGGCEISMMMAIDFTGSNGNPVDPRSLHYLGGGANQYEQAIRAVGDVLAYYDNDGQIPVWGFGGKAFGGPVSHCFALNGNYQNPSVQGVEGALQLYRHVMPNMGLSGPTLFSQILQSTTAIASQQTGHQTYHVLLILTDGVINDMEQTIDNIIRMSSLPVSIIIVGVGNADFGAMDALDCDEGKLSNGRQTAERDIVQFVPFNKFAHSPGALAKQTLAELPQQVVDFFRSRGIAPLPRQAPTRTLEEEFATLNVSPPPEAAAPPAGPPPPSYDSAPSDGPPTGYAPPPTGAAPGYAPPPTGAAPGYAAPPTGAAPGYAAPPATAAPGYAAPPATAAPGYAAPPATAAPGYAPPPTGAAPGYAAPAGTAPAYGPPAGAPDPQGGPPPPYQ